MLRAPARCSMLLNFWYLTTACCRLLFRVSEDTSETRPYLLRFTRWLPEAASVDLRVGRELLDTFDRDGQLHFSGLPHLFHHALALLPGLGEEVEHSMCLPSRALRQVRYAPLRAYFKGPSYRQRKSTGSLTIIRSTTVTATVVHASIITGRFLGHRNHCRACANFHTHSPTAPTPAPKA